ncbi:hypothetical protein Dimus_035874 [Dionaea muscipula]
MRREGYVRSSFGSASRLQVASLRATIACDERWSFDGGGGVVGDEHRRRWSSGARAMNWATAVSLVAGELGRRRRLGVRPAAVELGCASDELGDGGFTSWPVSSGGGGSLGVRPVAPLRRAAELGRAAERLATERGDLQCSDQRLPRAGGDDEMRRVGAMASA